MIQTFAVVDRSMNGIERHVQCLSDRSQLNRIARSYYRRRTDLMTASGSRSSRASHQSRNSMGSRRR